MVKASSLSEDKVADARGRPPSSAVFEDVRNYISTLHMLLQ